MGSLAYLANLAYLQAKKVYKYKSHTRTATAHKRRTHESAHTGGRAPYLQNFFHLGLLGLLGMLVTGVILLAYLQKRSAKGMLVRERNVGKNNLHGKTVFLPTFFFVSHLRPLRKRQ